MQFSKTGCLKTYLNKSPFDNGKLEQIGVSSILFKSIYSNFNGLIKLKTFKKEYLKFLDIPKLYTKIILL